MFKHEFIGSLDGYCEVCNCQDGHSIHEWPKSSKGVHVQASDTRAVCYLLQTTCTLSVATESAKFYREMEFAWYCDVVQPARKSESHMLDQVIKHHKRLLLIADGWESRAAELSSKCAPCSHCGALTPDRDNDTCLSCGWFSDVHYLDCDNCTFGDYSCPKCNGGGIVDNLFSDYRVHYLDNVGDPDSLIPSQLPATQCILSQIAHREMLGKREVFAYDDLGNRVSLTIRLPEGGA